MNAGGKRETAESIFSARWTRKNEERREKRAEEGGKKGEKGKKREVEKEMQRLPYNGAPRAHKLHHNVISSSLFNEQWQRAAHTFSLRVFVVPASFEFQPLSFLRFLSFSLTLSFSPDALFVCPTSIIPQRPPQETYCKPCVALSVSKSVSNVIHLLTKPNNVPYPNSLSRIEISISSTRERVTARCQSSFLYYARAIYIIRDCRRICIRNYAPSLSQRARCVYIRFPRYIGFLRIIASTRDLIRNILSWPGKTVANIREESVHFEIGVNPVA